MKIMASFRNIRVNILLHFSDAYGKSKIYKKYLEINIGRNVRIMGRPRFGTEPYLIKIGNNVTITEGVTFLTHDGGVGLFRSEYKGINVFGRIIVGNDVFIGANTTILPGVRIGNCVVIGAGSVVTKDVQDNVVVAGVPAKTIRAIDDYKENCIKKAVYIHSSNTEERKKEILDALKNL